jgi:hypothetical protein
MKSMVGLNIPLRNPLDTLQRRLGFKVSSFKFTLFLKRNLNTKTQNMVRAPAVGILWWTVPNLNI